MPMTLNEMFVIESVHLYMIVHPHNNFVNDCFMAMRRGRCWDTICQLFIEANLAPSKAVTFEPALAHADYSLHNEYFFLSIVETTTELFIPR